jgi:hypothetical protein
MAVGRARTAAGDAGDRVLQRPVARDGLIALASALVSEKRDLIIFFVNRTRLPAIFSLRFYAEAGGLASYGVDNHDLYRRAASYVDRILRGDKPSDLNRQGAWPHGAVGAANCRGRGDRIKNVSVLLHAEIRRCRIRNGINAQPPRRRSTEAPRQARRRPGDRSHSQTLGRSSARQSGN